MYRSRKSAAFEMKRNVFSVVPAKAGTQPFAFWIPAFAGMTSIWAAISITMAVVAISPVHAQDVRGLEVCTAEKQMERRTSCLQANIDFLQNVIDRNAREARQKLDVAGKELAASRNEVAALKASLAAIQARLEKLEKPEKTEKPNSDAPKK